MTIFLSGIKDPRSHERREDLNRPMVSKKIIRREAAAAMRVDRFQSSDKILGLLTLSLTESGDGGSALEEEQISEKIAASKNRRIPVGIFVVTLVAIVLTLIVLEYFI